MFRSSNPTLRDSLSLPKGIVVFFILIISSSFLHMQKLHMDRDWYYQTFSYWPVWLINVRYAFSWFQRVAGITAAVGVLFYNNLCRKLVLVIGIFTICTVPWKHPYEAFLKHAQYLDHQYGAYVASISEGSISFAEITRIAQLSHWLLDILFWVFWIWYFLRPSVKTLFIKNHSLL